MNIDIDLNLNKTKKQNSEITDFMKELEKSLNKTDSLYEQLMKEHELAPKYRGQLKELIKDTMRDISYDEPFKYIEYSQNKDKYYIYHYESGKFKRDLTSPEELAKNHLSIGNIYTFGKNNQLKRDIAIEYEVKSKISTWLWDFEEDT